MEASTTTTEHKALGSPENPENQAPTQERSKPHPRAEYVEAHILCNSCTQLISKSRLIQEFMGTAEPEDAYTIWKRLKGKPRTEVFPRTHAISSLADHEANDTCHLCSILWHNLPHDSQEHGGCLNATVVEDRSVDHLPVTFEVVPNPTDEGSGASGSQQKPRDVRILLKRYRGNTEPLPYCSLGPMT